MRISTTQIYNAGLRAMSDAQVAVSRAQAEISSGKRVLTPADDPAGSALALRVEQEQALNTQYTRNAQVAQHDVQQQEAQLQSIEDVLVRVRELAIQAGNGALSASDRSAIVSELDAKKEELLGLFNSRNANGEFLFAGFQGKTQPFVARGGGAVYYQGDSGSRALTIAPGVDVTVLDDGNKLFNEVPAANRTFATRPGVNNTGSGDITVGRITDQAAFDAIYPDDLVITFASPPSTYSVSRRNSVTGALTAIATAQPYTSGAAITVGGTEVKIIGTPSATDTFVIESSRTQSILTTVQRLADSLRNSPDSQAGSADRKLFIAETLGNLDLAEQAVLTAHGEIGSRLQLVDDTRSEQASVDLINQKLLSDIQDVDINEAASRLAYQNFVLQAAQQSFVKISGLSLFNLLR